MHTKFDIIGDVHGHAGALEKLLDILGYENSNGIFRHPERKALFIGDYIDRGPDSPTVLEIVRAMTDNGHGIALMGNHEYNAICYNTEKPGGGYLRPHTEKNIHQHAKTVEQFKGRQDEYEAYIQWFKSLPLYYENDHFRAVHACWEAPRIEHLEKRLPNKRLPEHLLHDSAERGSNLYDAVDVTLKGREMPLPGGASFKDKDGHKRTDIRIRWWLDPSQHSLQQMSIIESLEFEDGPCPEDYKIHYKATEKPVFFGHYWQKGEPSLFRANICCVDFSIAKDGILVAYRYDGEQTLKDEKFVYVRNTK